MPGVLLAYCSPLAVAARFTNSLTALIDHDFHGARHLVANVSLLSGPRVAEARSQLADFFLMHEAQPEWLLMLDADMTFEPDLLDRLMAVASRETTPILGGLCFAGVHGGNVYPTLFRAYNEDDGHLAVEPVSEYPADALVKVGATGAACVLIHRGVFAAMKRPGPERGEAFDPARHGFGTLPNGRENPFPWWSEGLTTSKGIPLGEDIAFCRKAMVLGIPIHVHTGVKLGHCKEWVLTEASFEDYRREVNRPGPLLDAALAALRESGRFAPDDLASIADYLRPRRSLLRDSDRPAPKAFVLPEPEPVPA